MTADRRVPLKGTINFRDLGGYGTADGRTVKAGRIFRSDNLSRLSTTSFDRFLGLHIKLIVDFRTPGERGRRPNRLPEGHTIRTEHLPISLMPAWEQPRGSVGLAVTLLRAPRQSFPPDLVFRMYRDLVTHAVPALQRLFQLLQDPANHPLLIMCAGGKDRTGFASAMILRALGVPPDVVEKDYALTGRYVAPLLDRTVRTLRVLSLFRVPDASIRPLLLARPEYLETAMQRLDEVHGGLDPYLRMLGVTPEAVTRLQSMLLEPSQPAQRQG